LLYDFTFPIRHATSRAELASEIEAAGRIVAIVRVRNAALSRIQPAFANRIERTLNAYEAVLDPSGSLRPTSPMDRASTEIARLIDESPDGDNGACAAAP